MNVLTTIFGIFGMFVLLVAVYFLTASMRNPSTNNNNNNDCVVSSNKLDSECKIFE